MAEADVERDIRYEDGKVTIFSKVKEVVSKEEFNRTYMMRASELENLRANLDVLKAELRKMDIEETDEIKEFKEKLITANKLVRKDELIEQIKKLERKELKEKDDMRKFNPVAQQIKNESEKKTSIHSDKK